jgi:hypothetical protein
LTDPLNYYSTICGYISKQDGLVYPCDPGCCGNSCENNNKTIFPIEVRPSAGVSLPEGYGNNLATSVEPTPIRGASDFNALPSPYTSSYKVWEILLIAILPLIMVLVLSFFLT